MEETYVEKTNPFVVKTDPFVPIQNPLKEGERWNDIPEEVVPGRKPYYAINSYGEVMNTDTGKYLKDTWDTKGYSIYHLQNFDKNNSKKPIRTHRIVIQTFNYFDGCKDYFVDHIDGNKKNNYIENLRYADAKSNAYYFHNDPTQIKYYNDNHPDKITFKAMHEDLENGMKMIDVARKHNVDVCYVHNLKNDKCYKEISKK